MSCWCRPKSLAERVRKMSERALRSGAISIDDAALLRQRYVQGLREYTYLSLNE